MNIVTSIGGKICASLVDPLGRQLGYLVDYNDNIEKFRKQTEKLEVMREMVQVEIEGAKRNGELVQTCVQKWLAGVDDAIVAKNHFAEEEEAEANKRCLNGWCINLRSRYKYSKRAKMETDAIIELQEQRELFKKVSRPASPPGIISSSTKFCAFKSRRPIMKQVMETLMDENIHIIGICGMGGIGKTFMVKEIGKQAKEDKIFDEAVMAVVSQTPNLETIQEEIASKLGLKFNGRDRAGSLWNRIKQKRILVILDDVWGRLELDEVGIPYGNDHKGCKIVLTSRSTDVCNQMDAQKIFSVGALSKKESWSLFRKTAGEIVDSLDINPIATKVVAKCGGLPIAIVTIGRALRNKNKHVWKDASRELQKAVPTNIPGVLKTVFLPLKLSYDYLESKEAKSLFLLCCLYPEDFNIPVEELVSLGMGLQLFQNVDTVEDARDSAHSLVSILISSFLLLELEGNYWQGYVKMHDVVRDVAIYIKDDFLVKAGIGLREWPNMNTFDHLTAISLMHNWIARVAKQDPRLPNGLECSQSQALLLQCNSRLKNIPINFFQEMKDLKILDMNENPLISLPPSIQFLSELRTLCLCSSDKLDDISVIGKLTKLEILRLSGDGITAIPEDFSLLTQLRLFDLIGCEALAHISPGVISSLYKLEELHMSKSFRGWDEEQSRSNASLFELKSLTRLTVLNNIRISDVRFLPNEFEFQKLTRYHISIGTEYLPRNISSYSRNLRLTHDMSIPLLDCVKKLLERVEGLRLENCTGLRNMFRDLDNNKFIELKSLKLRDCNEMTYFFGICHGELPAESSFSNLRKITVKHCQKMLSIVPLQLLQRLKCLEEVSVQHCDSLVCVFEVERGVIAKEETKFLSLLKRLGLQHLPEMTHIWRGSTQFVSLCNLNYVTLYGCEKLRIVFPPALVQDLICLTSLEIWSCNSLEEIFGKQEAKEGEEIVVWKNDPNVVPYFNNLTRVNIRWCSELRILFTHSIAKGLVQLQNLYVESCEKLQKIVGNEEQGEASSTEKITFRHLQSVRLIRLPSLTSFCSKHYTIEWPALDDLELNDCPKMEPFGNGLQVIHKLKKIWYAENYEVTSVRDRNSTVHHIFIKEESIVPLQLLLRLQSLEEVFVSTCNSLVFVFEVERGVIGKDETKFLLMLKSLDLQHLPEMTHIWRGSTQFVSLCNLVLVCLETCKKLRIVFPPALVEDLKCLKFLIIRSCDSLEEIFGKQEAKEGEEIVVWKNDPNVVPCFNNLASVAIQDCGELRILFTHSIAKGLVQLQELYIISCKKLQQIVGNEDQGEPSSAEKIMFHHLHTMRLEELPSLTSFCSKHYTIEWPALEYPQIINCPKMEIFGSGLQVTPKLKEVEYGNERYCWKGDLNTTVLHIFKEEELARQQSEANTETKTDTSSELHDFSEC